MVRLVTFAASHYAGLAKRPEDLPLCQDTHLGVLCAVLCEIGVQSV